eukprot:TRINITY_DN6504_c1_g1_i1.p1 TRINITY_DN6504_c1_g1~~TRINITY_DN6504_c1_g1_i1.p1  ORF type:complete len:370 (-),score=134.54 TRINITY_DN6504_c1_g1_i1:93-1202(-)
MQQVGAPLVDIQLDPQTAAEMLGDVQAEPAQESEPAAQVPPTAGSSASSEASSGAAAAGVSAAAANRKVLATPATRHLAKQHGIDLAFVPATGKNGRVLKEDILRFIENGGESDVSEAATTTSVPPTGSSSNVVIREDRTEKLTGIRKAMVASMQRANNIPHFGYDDEIVFDNLFALREKLKPIAAERNVKLSYMPMIIKAASLALQKYPELNAHTNEDCTEITYKGDHNIGVAMDTPNGLIVPNIKAVQDKTIFDIAEELNHLQVLGSTNSVEVAHISGGTFTISNIGNIGGTYLSPVVPPPTVAIGALGRVQRVPRFDANDNVVPVKIMNVSWTADHRVVDGATMARFSNLWKEFIEEPESMLIQMR